VGFVGGQGGRQHRRRQTGLQMLLVLPLHHVHGALAVVVLMFRVGAQRGPLGRTGRGGHGAGHHAVDTGRGGRRHAWRRSGVRSFRGRRTVGDDRGGVRDVRGGPIVGGAYARDGRQRSAPAGQRSGRGGHVVDEQATGTALGLSVIRRMDHEQRFHFTAHRRFGRTGHFVLDAAVHVQGHVEVLDAIRP